MIEISDARTLTRIRRQLLAAQGFLQARPFGSGAAGAHCAIQHLGYVQIDSISVVERAHHHVLYSRVPGFKPDMSHQLLKTGRVFEYWAHAAAFLPMDDFRFSLPYKEAIRAGQVHWYKHPDTKLMQEILTRIRSEGPLKSRDLASNKTKSSGWWDWKPAKKAIEQLYMEGQLMVSDREGFEKTYDLAESVLPEGIETKTPSVEELAEHLLAQQLRSSAFVSLKGLVYLRRIPGLRDAAKTLLREKCAAHQLEQIRLGTGETYYCEAGLLERPTPRIKDRVKIVSPFDNSVIQRDRLRDLFGFEYQLECYVPETKRRYGYFSLPLLYGDRFVGRMDCKVHRPRAELEIKSLYIEANDLDEAAFVSAFNAALSEFVGFQGCKTVLLRSISTKRFKQSIATALH